MSKRAIILINDIKQYVVDDLYRLQLNDIRKFNTGDNIIYLYNNNLSKNIYILNDLIDIREEDKEHDLFLFKIKFKTSGDISNNTNNLSKIKKINRDKTIFSKYIDHNDKINRDQVNKAHYRNNIDIKKNINIYDNRIKEGREYKT